MNIPKIISRKDYEALITEKDNLLLQVNTLKEENTKLGIAKTDFELVKVAVEENKKLKEQVSQLEAKIKDLETSITIVSDSTEKQVVHTLANIGVPADELPTATEPKESVLEASRKLQGRELSNYIMQNKAAIFAESKSKKQVRKTKE